MVNKLKISVSKEMKDGIVSTKKVSVREKILRKILWSIKTLTILVPGDSVKEIEIVEMKGSEEDGKWTRNTIGIIKS